MGTNTSDTALRKTFEKEEKDTSLRIDFPQVYKYFDMQP